MSWESRVPAVLDALAALWDATPGLAGLVLDGPAPIEGADPEVLSVGHDGTDDSTSTDGVISPEGFGDRPQREQFTVTCLIAVVNGSGDIQAARSRAYTLLGHAAEAVAGDWTLGGLVMKAHVQDHALSQVQDDRGALARLTFTVFCDGYTVR